MRQYGYEDVSTFGYGYDTRPIRDCVVDFSEYININKAMITEFVLIGHDYSG